MEEAPREEEMEEILAKEMQEVLANADVSQAWSKDVCEEVGREAMLEFGDAEHINFDEWVRRYPLTVITKRE